MASYTLPFLLFLVSVNTSLSRDLEVIQLADGSTSKPFVLLPLEEHEHSEEEPDAPANPEHLVYFTSTPPDDDVPPPEPLQDEPSNHSTNTATTTTTPPPATTTTSRLTTPTTTTTVATAVVTNSTPVQPSPTTTRDTPGPTTTPPPLSPRPSHTTHAPLPCHESCLVALNSTGLHPHAQLVLREGSELTLVCEVPLTPDLVLENLAWLYQSEEVGRGQCALNTQDFIASCQGFQTITHIDDRNDTYIRDTIKVGNVRANYSGQYICQVEITCCPHTRGEHVMNHGVRASVTVWLDDYTLDLAVMASLALGLVLTLLAATVYLARQKHGDYVAITDKTCDVKPTTVLHIPLVDEHDDDSFDSNFDEHD